MDGILSNWVVSKAKEDQWVKSSQGIPQEVVKGDKACFTTYQELF